MRLSRFFITRPIFAAVIAILITVMGAIAYFALPVSQYPDIVPPTVTVNATYPGSRAVTKIKGGVVTVDIRGSLFCEVRETSVEPLCGFYASAIARVLQLFDVSADARVNECSAVGARRGCVVSVTLPTGRATDSAVAA